MKSRRLRMAAVEAMVAAAALSAGACRIEKASEAETGTDFETFATHMLERAARAWNTGDPEALLAVYLASETTTYAQRGAILVGFEEIRRHIVSRFEPGARRDSLRYEDVHTRRLGALYGLVTGRRILRGEEGVVESGPFTLVLRRVGGGWKIVHDHSLLGPSPEQDERTSDNPAGE